MTHHPQTPHPESANSPTAAEVNAAEQQFISRLPQPIRAQLEGLSYFQRRYLIRVAFASTVKASVRQGASSLETFGAAQALVHQAEADLIEWARQPAAQMEQLQQMYEIWGVEANRGDIQFRSVFSQLLLRLNFPPDESVGAQPPQIEAEGKANSG